MNKNEYRSEYYRRSGTKITYDGKGMIVGSNSATTNDIEESTDRKYISSADIAVLSNTSGVNTGDNAVNSLYSSIVGIPVGGTIGQVLSKIDGTDYNVQWTTGGGGGRGDALTTDPLSQFAATTKAQLNSVISDGIVMFIGDAPTSHTHVIADITDFGIYSTDIHSNIAFLNLVSGTNTGDQDLSGYLTTSNIDGGGASSVYGGTASIDGGLSNTF